MIWLYLGRPDGIGNRIEEIARLAAVASLRRKGLIIYLWNNLSARGPDRTYSLRFACKDVYIIPLPRFGWSPRIIRIFATRLLMAISFKPIVLEKHNDRRLCSGARKIFPTFSLQWRQESVLGIHIRGSDRILANPSEGYSDHFMLSKQEFYDFARSAVDYAISSPIQHIFICGDEPDVLEWVARDLELAGKKLIRPSSPRNIENEYVDFFALSNCSEVVMASKFSSFCLMAALVGGARVKTFNCSPGLLRRFEVDTL